MRFAFSEISRQTSPWSDRLCHDRMDIETCPLLSAPVELQSIALLNQQPIHDCVNPNYLAHNIWRMTVSDSNNFDGLSD